MAFFKTTKIIDTATSTLGKIDRTINRDTGFSCRLVKRGKNISYEIKKVPTRGGSKARHARAAAYFQCDCKWKRLNKECKEDIAWYQRHFGSKKSKTLSTYHFYMQYCLYDNDCAIFQMVPCFDVYIYATEENDILTITGKATLPLFNLKSELYVNGELKKTTRTDHQGGAEYSLTKEEV